MTPADNVQSVIGQVYALTADIKDASVFTISPGSAGPGYGMGNALELHIPRTRWAVISMSSSPLPSVFGSVEPTA